jgi:opacity protein-like surface antigen
MKKFFPVLALWALALPNAAFGQAAEFWVGGGTSTLTNNGIGSLDPAGTSNDVTLKGGFRINFRLALNTRALMGHEVGYAYNRTQLAVSGSADQGMAIHQGFYNFLVYGTKEGSRIRPFATGGGHFSNFVPPGSSAGQGGGNTKFGVNYGGGLKVRITSMFALRVDFRQYLTGKPFDLPLVSGKLRQNEISAGFGLLL